MFAAISGAYGHAFQTVNVSSLNAGGQPYRLSADLGQFGHPNSSALSVTFEDGSGNVLGTASVTDSADSAAGKNFMQQYSASGTVPAGTTELFVSWGDTSASSTFGNDAADDLAFDIGPEIPPLPVTPTTVGFTTPSGGAPLDDPYGVAAAKGNVYVSNTKDNVVEELKGGATTVVAGSFTGSGESGDGGPATSATLYQPAGLAVDSEGDLFIADSGNDVVREVTSDGTIHLVAGNGTEGHSGNGGQATSAELDDPQDIAVDGQGDVFIADAENNEIREVLPNGVISDFAGNGTAGYSGDGGPATAAELNDPSGVAVDSDGNVYIADSANNLIRRVDAKTGEITTVAGNYAAGQNNNGEGGSSGDGGPAASALLNSPQGVAVDPAGDLFVADTFNKEIREVTPDGTISTVTSATAGPYGVAVDPSNGDLYVANTPSSNVMLLAEAGTTAPTGPGPVGVVGPPPTTPESPAAVLLPIAGVAITGAGGMLSIRRRRRSKNASR
jgi:DNA-binding beta-propeller fold protein YncE